MLTVGIPIHNNLSGLKRCLSGVFDNIDGVGGAQLVLVDDQSTDRGIRDELEFWVSERSDTVMISTADHTSQLNPNLALGVNLAMDQMRPHDRYFWNVETDVYPQPGCLQALIDGMERHRAAMVTPLFLHPDGVTLSHAWPAHPQGTIHELEPHLLADRRTVWSHLGCNLLSAKMVAYHRIRIPLEYRLWCADFALHWEIETKTGHEVWYIRDAHAIHEAHGSSLQHLGNVWADHGLEDESAVNRKVREQYGRTML